MQFNWAVIGLVLTKMAIWQGELDFGESNVVVYCPATCSDKTVAYLFA